MSQKNMGRLAQDMKRELIAIIGRLKDPRLEGGLLTVTRLDVTPDLDVAKVYVSVMGREDGPKPAIEALNRAAGHVRTEVSKKMHIRKAPASIVCGGRRCRLCSPHQRAAPHAECERRRGGLPARRDRGINPALRKGWNHQMTEQLNVQQMAERLCAADNILILCHKNPDGDTIGCGSALCHALKALGKTAAVLCSDAVPSRYSFTAPVPFRGEFEPKTVVAVDVASVQLFGENNGMPQYTRHIDLCIDHHTGNSGYADFTLLDGNAAAAAELLYEVISEMGVEITPLIANFLYTGLATDTGCFRFSSTTANTHIVAAKLILAGAQVEELNTLLFDTKPRERMEAERIARNHLEYHLEGRCALMYLTRDEIEQSGVDPADLEELTSLPISIEGVKVGLLLRQQPGGSYRISVRAAKGVDACAIARRLGGGGHTRAAGCELLGNLDNAKSAILAEVEAELDRPETQEES